MKKIFLFCLLAASLGATAGFMSSCNNITISREDGVDIEDTATIVGGTKKYALRDFQKIDMSGMANIYLLQDTVFSIVAKGSEAALRSLKIGMKGERLVIARDGSFSVFDDDDHEVSVYITMPYLDELETAGVGKIQSMTVFKQDRPLKIDISGACDVDMHVEIPECKVASSGVGAIKLIGSAPLMNIDISGAGNVNSVACIADTVRVDASGVGDAKVYAARYLNVDASGAGNVRYKGNPALDVDVSGVADVGQIN